MEILLKLFKLREMSGKDFHKMFKIIVKIINIFSMFQRKKNF